MPWGPEAVETESMGPLKGLRFRFAKTRPGEGGGLLDECGFPNAALDSFRPGGKPARTRRMLFGKEDDVGVAGRTLMLLLCGDLVSLCECPDTETAGEAMLAEDVDEALL